MSFAYVPEQGISSLSNPGHFFPPFFGTGFTQVLVLCFFPFVLQEPKDPHWLQPPFTEIGNPNNDMIVVCVNVAYLCTWTSHFIFVWSWTWISSPLWGWVCTGSSPLFLSIYVARSKGPPLTPASIHWNRKLKQWLLCVQMKLDYVPEQVISSLSDPGQGFPPFSGAGVVQVLVLCFLPFVLQDPKDPHWLQPPSTGIGN